MLPKKSPSDFFWLLTVFAVLTVGMIVAAGLALVHEFDQAAMLREQSVVEKGIQGRIKEVADIAASEVIWDEAVLNLDNHFDSKWAQENIGIFFSQPHGFMYSFVLSSDDRPLFAGDGESPLETAIYGGFEKDALPLIRSVRAQEVRRGPSHRDKRVGQTLSESIQASGLAYWNGKLCILSASLVQPDLGVVEPRGPKAPIVLTVMRIDEGFVNAFADRFQLDNLRLDTGSTLPASGQAAIALRNFEGAQLGSLEWSPQDPGGAILSRLGTPVLGILTFMTIGLLWLYRRSRRMAAVLVTSEARAIQLAYHDALTGLANRALLFDRLAHALHAMRRSGEHIALLCIDLERLKEINDTFGHHAGDDLIREAAARLSAQCRSNDTVARLSGAEFAIVQSAASMVASASLAARLTECMTRPFELASGRVFIGCSIGICVVEDPNIEAAELLRQADLALFRAKQTGSGHYSFFDLEMDTSVKARHGVERDLRDAMAQESLYLVYQPQINEVRGMVGVEALARWNHPIRGNVPPGVFVPIAEDCGLIMELGLFTLRRAFEDSKRWNHLKVAVNVSAKQLRIRDFVTRVTEIVADTNVDPKQFELEITEGILLGDDPDTLTVLAQLRGLGFSLALDDFGTGYSSLGYLQRYPIDKIKIDRSFVANLGVESESEAVIGAIVTLARALNLGVIAEGVETTEQHLRLCAAGCYDMQGYLFSKPVPATEIDRLCPAVPPLALPSPAHPDPATAVEA
ncbi:MAG: EAL domain-containing protein [Burkholderiaceae bacterium]